MSLAQFAAVFLLEEVAFLLYTLLILRSSQFCFELKKKCNQVQKLVWPWPQQPDRFGRAWAIQMFNGAKQTSYEANQIPLRQIKCPTRQISTGHAKCPARQTALGLLNTKNFTRGDMTVYQAFGSDKEII